MDTSERPKFWLGRLTKLNPNTGKGVCRGKAPHKPLLILSLLDMIEAGELKSPVFTRSPGLVLRFRSYGTIVADRWPTRLDARLPFYHLSTQGLWRPFSFDGQVARSPESCSWCEIDPELFQLLGDEGFRVKARMVLIHKYFDPLERVALLVSLGLESGSTIVQASRVAEEAEETAKRKGRSARFSVRICTEYRFTCALTGYKCMTGDGATIVDAAHIEAWSMTQNDDLTNGLALSKNAHWMFDEGLWSADDQLRVIVNPYRFAEHGPDGVRLITYAGRHIQFDPDAKLRPSVEMFRRHRQRYGIRIPGA